LTGKAIAPNDAQPAEEPFLSTLPSTSPFALSRSEAVLVAVTVIWGATFLVVQQALSVSGPLFFVGLRFGTAALMMALIAAPVLRGLTWLEVKAGVMIGIAIFLGYTLQTYGLQYIPSSKSAFITALYVPIVPLLQWLVLKKPPGIMAWTGIVLAFIGLALLAGPDGTAIGMGLGELLTLLCAIAISAEIILIGGFAGKVDARRVTVVQLAVTSLLAFGFMAPLGEPVPAPSWLLILSAVGLGLASAGIQLAMNWAQKTVSPTRATLIYAGEPVWAGIVGRVVGERLPAAALIGAALIVVGVIVSEMKPLGWFKRRASARA
jgi:drug/metabolite transporter (DMT)-like permease